VLHGTPSTRQTLTEVGRAGKLQEVWSAMFVEIPNCMPKLLRVWADGKKKKKKNASLVNMSLPAVHR